MLDRPKAGEKAALIQVAIGAAVDDSNTQEFHLLAESAGAKAVYCKTVQRAQAEVKFYIGKGQALDIAEELAGIEVELVIFNAPLTPAQQRNLERLLNLRVLDRSGLVLDIFAQRARSHEGKLQVELAQLNHLATRLVRGWTHLERQKGGIGLRGPGETQLETDRRLLSNRVKQLKKRLEKVQKQRCELRKFREKQLIPVVALAGYTNTGKSSLFNQLTDSNVLAKNQLFATLDPTWRKLKNHPSPILLADTVGFISDLPHELVEAFKSTLEETAFADLILHVIDANDPERRDREKVVEQVLAELGAGDAPQIKVYNKIDLTNDQPKVVFCEKGLIKVVYCSAKTGVGLDLLQKAIVEHLQGFEKTGYLVINPQEGALRSQLFAHNAVLEESIQDDGALKLKIKLSQADLDKLSAKFKRSLILQIK